MDAFPDSPSSTVLPVYLPDKADVMEHVVRQGMVKAFISYQKPQNNRIFVSFSSPTWFQKKTFMDNFKRTIHETRMENRFDPEADRNGTPHPNYPIPAGTHYILMTIQKTASALDVVPETILMTLLQKGFRLGDFRKAKKYHQKAYKLPPPTPAHTPAEERPALGKRPLSKNPFQVPCRYKKIWITPASR
ncbi:uncharacterized protein NPIL_69011 [Nephila pilipes]|uniref:Uncharacterized protein n=1 Tax=Nephila pilipes TaxID=299642 RepID=A0A8X6MV82_NEPPI|nr:uncharacterized protein NPIL_69011 [Nephila pilipes]